MKSDTDSNQYKMQNPLHQYPKPNYPKQPQKAPGLAKNMSPKPDHGEDSYVGHGRLAGRKAIITGGDSGIGRATAIAYAREGADIVLAYLPQEEEDARDVIELIEKTGQNVYPVPGDLSSEKECKVLIDKAVEKMGSIDLLTIIAGKQVAIEDIADITTEQFDMTYRTNIYALFWLCKFAIPHMPPGSSIITTSSIQAYQPSAHLIDYASTKAAIANFTKGLAQQVIDKGIRVNSVAPGPIWTPLQPSGGQLQDSIPTFGEQVPYKRAGQPVECAPAYVFLASQESSYITAEVIGVTGGQHLP